MKNGLLGALISITLIASPASSAPTQQRPNIVVIVTDNQPWWAMGCSGNQVISTPHLDQLAQDGTRFTNAFVTTPICAASRASLFTGLYRRNHRFTFNTKPLQAQLAATSYPAVLRQSGYHTALIGKFGIESNGKLMLEERSLNLMFDHFDNFEHWGKSGPKGYFVTNPDGSRTHLTDVTADKAMKYLRGRTQQDLVQPFCLTLCFNAPHAQDDDPKQYFWPERFDNLYQDATIPPPSNSDSAFFDAQPAFLRNSLGRTRWKWRFDTPEKYQSMMKGMYRMVTAVDDAIGRLRHRLVQLGLHKNTIILFTSDNGMFCGERGLSDCWLLYEECIRVPFIIYDPRQVHPPRRSAVRDEMVLNTDIAPTILDWADAKSWPPMNGRSLRPLLLGRRDRKWREDFLCEHLFAHKQIPKSEGVRTKRWKYIRYFEQKPVYEELYDLAADPHERSNLARSSKHADELARLRNRCNELIRFAP
jgi:arylsulfatase A-like enzyme